MSSKAWRGNISDRTQIKNFNSGRRYTIPVNFWLPIELRLFSQGFFIFLRKCWFWYSIFTFRAVLTYPNFDLGTQFFLLDIGEFSRSRCFRVYVWTDENGTFSKTLRTHHQFQSTPHNIRNLFKMADGRIPCLSFILGLLLGLISNLTCFQI